MKLKRWKSQSINRVVELINRPNCKSQIRFIHLRTNWLAHSYCMRYVQWRQVRPFNRAHIETVKTLSVLGTVGLATLNSAGLYIDIDHILIRNRVHTTCPNALCVVNTIKSQVTHRRVNNKIDKKNNNNTLYAHRSASANESTRNRELWYGITI